MKSLIFALAVTLAGALAASAATIIVDGDTIDIDGTRIRILDIDTPETSRSRCENELTLGLKAKRRLRELLKLPEKSPSSRKASIAIAAPSPAFTSMASTSAKS